MYTITEPNHPSGKPNRVLEPARPKGKGAGPNLQSWEYSDLQACRRWKSTLKTAGVVGVCWLQCVGWWCYCLFALLKVEKGVQELTDSLKSPESSPRHARPIWWNSELGSGRLKTPPTLDIAYLAEPGLAFGTFSFFNPPFISATNSARAIQTSDLCSLD